MKKLITCLLTLLALVNVSVLAVEPPLTLKSENVKLACDSSYTTFCQQIIKFCPIYKNVSGKTITGIKFDVAFKDAFGDTIKESLNAKIGEKIKNGNNNTCGTYWLFNKYDKDFATLSEAVESKNLKVIYKIKTIVFEDGEITSYGDDLGEPKQ